MMFHRHNSKKASFGGYSKPGKKIILLAFFLFGGMGLVFAASTIWSTTDIPIKTITDSVSHGEFNSLVKTIKGLYRDDAGTPSDYMDDRFGFRASAPSVSFESSGAIKVGQTGSACTASLSGSMRYNPGIKNMEFCDGITWKAGGVLGK